MRAPSKLAGSKAAKIAADEKFVLAASFETQPNRAVFWSSGGFRHGRDPRDERNFNEEIAHVFCRKKNQAQEKTAAPYVCMQDLAEGDILLDLTFTNCDVSRQTKIADKLFSAASLQFARNASGTIHVIADRASPNSSFRTTEYREIMENPKISAVNAVSFKSLRGSEFSMESWTLTECTLPKLVWAERYREFSLRVSLHYLEDKLLGRGLTRFAVGNTQVSDPEQLSLNGCVARFFGEMLLCIDEIKRLKQRARPDEVALLDGEDDRLHLCANLLVKVPELLTFANKPRSKRGEDNVIDELVVAVAGRLKGNEPFTPRSETRRSSLWATIRSEEQAKMIAFLKQRYPDLNWKNVQ